MSGQPYKYASDPAKYRAQYMENLELRGQLDDTVLQAVKNYVVNGTLPPTAQIADTRTTTEKLLDTEKIKLSIIKDLEKITDYQTAQSMVQGLSQSPLNTDNKLIVFMAQTGEALIEQLKKIYKFGIKGDANDIQVFVEKINNAYVKSKQGVDSVKGLIESGYGSGGIMNKNDWDDVLKTVKSSLVKIRQIGTRDTNIEQNKIEILVNKLTRLYELTPSQSEMDKLVHFMSIVDPDTPESTNIIMGLDFIKNQYPKKTTIEGLVRQLETSTETTSQARFVNEVVNKLIDVIPNDLSLISSPVFQKVAKRSTDYRQQNINIQPVQPGALTGPGQVTIQDIKDDLYKLEEQVALNGVSQENFNNLMVLVNRLSFLTGLPLNTWNPVQTENRQNDFNKIIQNMKKDIIISGNGIRGSGIYKVPKPIKPKAPKVPIYQQVGEGIKSNKKYYEFGKYILNRPALQDNILHLQTVNGQRLAKFPKYKMSNNLSSVIKNIIGGGIPSYKDISNLTDEEKDYLHRVSRHADINDKINVPSPSKDKEDKDFHQFEVMKGEILSGNDNKDLIKTFKILLLKMSKSGKLPKSEVAEIMEDIISLGY